ncbi:hypothetical protein, partial [Salmonella sp. SAL4355]|uniref:hypothetical protein n=1 Tax=Salmonella sp. SAL4355 TaxID=3159876 RepID=UPI00397AFC55
RYAGQSYELTIAMPEPEAEPEAAVDALRRAFASEHERQYSHASLDDPIALVNLRRTARVARHPAAGSAWRLAPSGR